MQRSKFLLTQFVVFDLIRGVNHTTLRLDWSCHPTSLPMSNQRLLNFHLLLYRDIKLVCAHNISIKNSYNYNLLQPFCSRLPQRKHCFLFQWNISNARDQVRVKKALANDRVVEGQRQYKVLHHWLTWKKATGSAATTAISHTTAIEVTTLLLLLVPSCPRTIVKYLRKPNIITGLYYII